MWDAAPNLSPERAEQLAQLRQDREAAIDQAQQAFRADHDPIAAEYARVVQPLRDTLDQAVRAAEVAYHEAVLALDRSS